MLLRPALLLLASAVASSTLACSSLTRPDDIKIYAEPLPGAKAAPAAAPMPAPGGARAPQGQPRPPTFGGAPKAPAPAAALPANCGG